jgi:hypothetical protein
MRHYKYLEGVFKCKWVSNFISRWCFNKVKIEKFFYFSFFLLKKKFIISPLFLFFEVIEKLKPSIGLNLYSENNGKKKNLKACPVILDSHLKYKKSLYWFMKSSQFRKDFFFQNKLYKDIVNLTLKYTVNSTQMKREYYNYAVLFKSSKRFHW